MGNSNRYAFFHGGLLEDDSPYNSKIGMLMSSTILSDEKRLLKIHGSILLDKLSHLDVETQSTICTIIELNMGVAYLNGYHNGMVIMANALPQYRQYLIDKFVYQHNLVEKEFMSIEEWQKERIEDEK